jgi:hypothetical protein
MHSQLILKRLPLVMAYASKGDRHLAHIVVALCQMSMLTSSQSHNTYEYKLHDVKETAFAESDGLQRPRAPEWSYSCSVPKAHHRTAVPRRPGCRESALMVRRRI